MTVLLNKNIIRNTQTPGSFDDRNPIRRSIQHGWSLTAQETQRLAIWVEEVDIKICVRTELVAPDRGQSTG